MFTFTKEQVTHALISFCMLALVLALLFLPERLEKKWSFR